jgi:predicted lactoylglutathione lyase
MFDLDPLVVSDFPKAMEFWKAVLEQIDYAPQHKFNNNFQTFGKSSDCPNFFIAQGHAENLEHGRILLQVDNKEQVKAVHAKAITVGGKRIKVDKVEGEADEGEADEDQSRATFLDLEGNIVEVYVAKRDEYSWE